MNELGKKIRDIRKAKKITLVELAKQTGVAQASLSRIETGIMTGTVESHKKIAEALGISIADLYIGLDSRLAEIIHSEPAKESVTLLNDDLKLEVLTTNASNKKIVPTLYTINPGKQTQIENLERGVERFYWVVSGEVTVVIDKKEYILKNKHSLYFDASLQHCLKNETSFPAQVFCATSPAQL
jgi:transcriptional regulator with XRE-family HTH domain